MFYMHNKTIDKWEFDDICIDIVVKFYNTYMQRN